MISPGKTGVTYIATSEYPTPKLPTKHGLEQFYFRPLTLDQTWVGKSSTPIKK